MSTLEFEKPLAELEERIAQLESAAGDAGPAKETLERLRLEAQGLREKIYEGLSTWQKVQLSRHPERPYTLDYVSAFVDDFVELHGDRLYGDDPAIVSGFGVFRGRRIALVGHQKGRTTKDKLTRNFGMPHPEGYRKATRVMGLAERYGLPVVTLIDTSGAYPGLGAEERGQSEAIGASILAMSQLKVPSIAIVIGEGGSGGALALGVADRVLMMRYATYSVISPEGCASILWRDGAAAPKAAEQLRLLAEDALSLGIIDGIIAEPVGGAHRDASAAADALADALEASLRELEQLPESDRREQRYNKFRTMGAMTEPQPTSEAVASVADEAAQLSSRP